MGTTVRPIRALTHVARAVHLDRRQLLNNLLADEVDWLRRLLVATYSSLLVRQAVQLVLNLLLDIVLYLVHVVLVELSRRLLQLILLFELDILRAHASHARRLGGARVGSNEAVGRPLLYHRHAT